MSDTASLRALLEAAIANATDDDLSDGGRYFHKTCDDLTKCWHGDTGEYQDRADGLLVELLWNNRARFAHLLTEHEEMRKALEAVSEAMLAGGDGVVGDFGWSIAKLNKARPLVRKALSSLDGGDGK